MAILVTGANGFIGSAVVGRLVAAGHPVIAVVHRLDASARRLPAKRCVAVDMAAAIAPEAWAPLLQGVHAVVNCAGVLQDSARDSTQGVHVGGPSALFEACERAGVRRVIHLSAMGADRESLTRFSETKKAAEAALTARNLDWVILRPSVVVGRQAYGGSALFRALAALPVLPRSPEAGQLQVVQLDEVVRTVEFFLEPGAPGRLALEIAGPERLSFEAVVAAYRRWLGWPPAREVEVPTILSRLPYRIGDVLARFGWRPPIRTTARLEIVRGAVGDPSVWRRVTGIDPQPLAAALARDPSSVQERWFAQLYLLKPLALGVFSLFWIVTGLVSLGPGYPLGEDLMLEGGAGPLAGPSVVAGALADIAIGLAIAFRRTCRLGLLAALAISVFYALAGTVILPRLWIDPLGRMLKIFPIMVFNLLCLAIREER